MGVYNFKDYPVVLKGRISALKRGSDSSPMRAASFMSAQAKRFAPYCTGETRRNIRKKKLSHGAWCVESWVSPKSGPGSYNFRQNLWANWTPPHAVPRMRWNKYKPTLYGHGPAVYTASVTPFFSVAALLTEKYFRRDVKQMVRKSLQVNV